MSLTVVVNCGSWMNKLITKMFRMSFTNLVKQPKEVITQFMNSFDTVLTDCDGVLWLEEEPIEGSAEVINTLKELGKRVFFVTNNSCKIRDDFVKKAKKMNFKCEKDDIISTAVGPEGLSQELELVGIKSIGVGPDVMQTSFKNTLEEFKADPDIGAVVVGYDEHFSYVKMFKAATYLSNPNVLFVGTNSDEQYPNRYDYIVPGTGTILIAVKTAAQREPFIVGKPEAYIADFIKNEYGMDPKRTLMIGDRCNTDILLGTRCGFQTMLVLSGITTFKEATQRKQSKKQEEKDLVPDVYLEKLGDLLLPIHPSKRKQAKNECQNVVKVRRALFEPIDHEETQKFLEQELSKQSVNESEKWEFDFVNERPLKTKGRYEWTVVNSSSAPDLEKPRKKIEEVYDTSTLYPQTLSTPKVDGEFEKKEENSAVESMIVDGTPPKDSNKKQSLITGKSLYVKMFKAATYLSNPNVLFVGTNSDEQYPNRYDYIVPGTGTILIAVKTAAQREPFIVGKPESYIADFIKNEYGVDPKRTLMIGDRCNTDILLGTRCGFQTMLVLSGITTFKEVTQWKQSKKQEERDLVPDVYLEKLGDLLPYLN
ncbi:uncharacterized protein LOC112904570 [Agrilus planipennis]|uniref:Uncharacterized protein LOC112904570 n=1 Tax=Agrilus planipennis TaxID=224129 RepID=A0A7F5R4Z6_AGRPL|nr:uncharacterized protein LOC112904570 [Agrilus planipennis]